MLLGISNEARRHVIRRSLSRWGAVILWRAASSTSLRGYEYLYPAQPFVPRKVPNIHAKDIAVLGGGVTGLATAYNLAHGIPNARVTIFEQSNRTGGWIDSEVVAVDNGEVLFEWGPRSLRPDPGGAGWATMDLISHFEMTPSNFPIFVKANDVASRNRFLYYPDHLVRMPSFTGNPIKTIFGAVRSILSEPVFKGIPTSLLAEPRVSRRPSSWEDESVGDFICRRFGRAAADNVASAFFHGVYAGDIYQLSARTILPALWYAETRDPEDASGILLEMGNLMFKSQRLRPYKNVRFNAMTHPENALLPSPGQRGHVEALLRKARNSSMYTWATGMETIVSGLKDLLSANKRVTIRTSSEVGALAYDHKRRKVLMQTKSGTERLQFDYAVSTLRPSVMDRVVQKGRRVFSHSMPEIGVTDQLRAVDKAVSVMVVNLYYQDPDLIGGEHQGFGYLIPRSVAVDQNPERALGVIFGSFASGQRGAKAVRTDTTKFLTKEECQQRIEATKRDLREMEQELQQGSALRIPVRPGKPFSQAQSEAVRKLLHQSLQMRERKLSEVRNNAAMEIAMYERMLEGLEQGATEFTNEFREGQDTAEGTKLTVMLGGHWWNSWKEGDFPDEAEAIKMARSVLSRHLNIQQEPMVAKAKLQRDCIPQYPVGYRNYLADIHDDLLMKQFQGRLKVAGTWWQGGVGVNDCIRKARETAFAIREEWDDRTGLEEYTEEEKWCLEDLRTGSIQPDPMCNS